MVNELELVDRSDGFGAPRPECCLSASSDAEVMVQRTKGASGALAECGGTDLHLSPAGREQMARRGLAKQSQNEKAKRIKEEICHGVDDPDPCRDLHRPGNQRLSSGRDLILIL
jgi:hypothetical protein